MSVIERDLEKMDLMPFVLTDYELKVETHSRRFSPKTVREFKSDYYGQYNPRPQRKRTTATKAEKRLEQRIVSYNKSIRENTRLSKESGFHRPGSLQLS